MKEDFGSVIYKEEEYQLVESAYLTCRLFPGCYVEAKEGETYLDEWRARATDENGFEYFVTWQWNNIRGEEPEDAGDYSWSDNDISSVTPI